MSVPFELVERAALSAAHQVAQTLPGGTVFVLFAMTPGAVGHMTYVSNGCREDAVRVVDEWRESMKGRGFESCDLGTLCWLCGAEPTVTLRGPLRSVDLCSSCAGGCNA